MKTVLHELHHNRTLRPPLIRTKGFSLPNFLRLRLVTGSRFFFGRFGIGRMPKKIIFLHIAKSAGTTAKDYLTACVGSRKHGQTVLISDFFPDELVSEDDLRLAKAARFVSGHFSWSALEALEPEANTTFTTLCDPGERLWSLYYSLRTTANKNRRKAMVPVYRWARELDPGAFYAIDDARINHIADNVMVRQLSGNLETIPRTEGEWRSRLEQAKENLQKLTHICFKQTLDQDFVEVLRRAHYPVVEPIGRRNVTRDAELEPGRKSEVRAKFISQSSELIEPLVRWDREIYEYALGLRKSGKI